MSVLRLAGGFVAFAVGAAVVSALAANPDGRPPPMGPAAAPREAIAVPGKSDRLAIRAAKSQPVTWACPQEPWPYGCQWRAPTRKVLRPARPS
jgi:hypothetical protein